MCARVFEFALGYVHPICTKCWKLMCCSAVPSWLLCCCYGSVTSCLVLTSTGWVRHQHSLSCMHSKAMHLPKWQTLLQPALSSSSTFTSRRTVQLVRSANTSPQHRQQQWQEHVEPQQQQQRPQLSRTAGQQQGQQPGPQHAGDGRSKNSQSNGHTGAQRRPANRPQQQRWAPPHGHPASSDPRDIQFMQLQGLQQLIAEKSDALSASQLVSVFVRAAKLRPMPHQQQREALLGPTWAQLRGQLSCCKVSRCLHP
jgi:hypothetical protein